MLLSVKTVEAVADAVKRFRIKNLVIDPVMVSTSGKRLLQKKAREALVRELLPLAELVMPNIDEAGILAGMRVETMEDAREAARRIHELGPRFVLIKGGHMQGEPIDLFFNGQDFFEYGAERVRDKKLHGTGCVYSAAITAGLAKGMSMMEAIAAAKEFVTDAIIKAVPVGKGRLPII